MQDNALLTQYAQNGSEAAFSQLLAKHLPLVYRTCRRELGSDALAEDAAQVVFLLLARKAKTLRAGPSLAGWLYQTSVFVAKDIRKQEARRTRREEAVMQETLHVQTAPASEWDTIEPHLNAALSALKPADRDAVLLRFLEGHTLAETGTLLGLSEDAARMRCARALEKLRRHLTAHGAAVTGIALAALLTAESARPVSAHAASAVTQGVLQALTNGPAPNVLLLSKGVSHTMKIIKVKYAALAAAALFAGTAVPTLIHAVTFTTPSVKFVAPVAATQTSVAVTQTILLRDVLPGQLLSFLHWDKAVNLPAGVTQVQALPAQNALAVTATPAGFAKVQAIVKQLDVYPRQVKIVAAMAHVSNADLKASGIKFEVAPLTEPASNPAIIVYASGPQAVRLLQTLNTKGTVTQIGDITTTSDVQADLKISTTLPGGATISQQMDVTPHVNSDGSITLAMHPRFVDRILTHEASTTRTIKSGDTMVIVMSFAASQSDEANEMYFVTPTVK